MNKIQLGPKFKGINTVGDASALQFGECTDCTNVYLKEGQVHVRPKIRSLVSNTSITNSYHMISAYYTRYATVKRLYCVLSNGDIYYQTITGDEYGTLTVRDTGYTDLLTGTVQWLEYGEDVILFNQTTVLLINSDLTITPIGLVSEVDSTTLTVLTGTSFAGYGFVGSMEYAFKLTNNNDDSFMIWKYPSLLGYSYLYKDYPDVKFKFTFADSFSDPTDFTLEIFRRDIHPDADSDAAWEDVYFYKVGEIDPLEADHSADFIDTINYETKRGNATLDFSEINLKTTGIVCATWYQNRVIWGYNDGTYTISKLNQPFSTVADLMGNILPVKGIIDIRGLVTYLGTGIFFTDNGIFHLVGNINDDIEDSDFSVYQATPDGHFLFVLDLPIIHNGIYAIGLDGLYKYDARKLTFLGSKIKQHWFDNVDDFTGLCLTPDPLRNLLLVHVPVNEMCYVYHFEKEYIGLEVKEGEWTKYSGALFDGGSLLAPLHNEGELTEVPTIFGERGTTLSFYQLKDTGDDIETVSWDWSSQEFDAGDNSLVKHWKELLVSANNTGTITVTKLPGTASIGSITTTSDVLRYKKRRLILNYRDYSFQFKLAGTGAEKIKGLNINFQPLGFNQ